uniref:BMA-LPR-7 n=1 Tax=Brugia malayi TaxID=6279 RepID=A0A1I9GD46_BRUMA|nr:BMA-LPR-7 [Brugia malayi]
MAFPSNLDILSAVFIVQCCCPILTQYNNLLDIFGINTGRTGTVSDRIPIDDITRLQKPLPHVTLLDGIPSVPGVIGSFPGIGGCLLRRTPLVNQRSPSLFQNFVRFIPGVQDYLSNLVKTPIVDFNSLMGKYYWVKDCFSYDFFSDELTRHAKIFKNVTEVRNTSVFSTMDSFLVNSPHGTPKMGFGYGIIHSKKVYIYVQEDPCPYQIVITGPKNTESGQYEYIVITNWTKFPLVAMTRDLAQFNANYRNELIQRLRNEGYIYEFSEIIGNWMHEVDWTDCKPLTPTAFISNIINRLIIGL